MNRNLGIFNNLLSFWVILFAIMAFFFPGPFLFLKTYIKVFFGITMFGIGMVITEEDYRNILRSPRAVLFGNLCQYTIMPGLALVTSYIFSLPPEITVGLVLTGSAPGAMTSNVISYLSNADVAYSVSLIAVATLLSPVLTPLLTKVLAGKEMNVEFLPMFFDILFTVVVPLLLGFLVRLKFPSLVEQAGELPATISVISIVVITSAVVAANRTRLGMATIIILGAVVFHNLAGMVLGYLAGSAVRFSFIRKKTLSIEIGMQNAGMGVFLALEHFSERTAIPAAIFTIWCILSASLLVKFWKILAVREGNGEAAG